MMNNNNSIWYKKYLIGKELQEALVSRCLPNHLVTVKTPSLDKLGVYLVMFRKIIVKNKPSLVYNYIFYIDLFTDLLLLYLITKHKFIESNTCKDWGDFYTFIDINLGSNKELIHKLKTSPKEYNEYLFPYGYDTIQEREQQDEIEQYLEFVDRSKKLVTIINNNDMPYFLCLLLNNDPLKFLLSVSQSVVIEDNKCYTDNLMDDINLLNKCLFIVKDINVFINKVNEDVNKNRDENNKIIVSEGPTRFRGQTSSISGFLYSLDKDFRDNLYAHNRFHIKRRNISYENIISKSSFSFQNIHENLGNNRWYSTKSNIRLYSTENNIRWYSTLKVNDKKYKNRQHLFQSSYKMVSNILDKNSNIGNKEVQMEIEKLLFNQEKCFSSQNLSKIYLKFDKESFDFLQKKVDDISKLIENSNIDSSNYKLVRSTEFHPLAKKLILFLINKEISNMLIAHFLEILSVETIKVDDDLQTPGISSLTTFKSFGKKIINRYVYLKYINSDEFRNNNNYNLSQFKEDYKEKLFDMNLDENSYAKIGGIFVWHLVSANLLYQDLDRKVNDNKETAYYIRVNQEARNILMKKNLRVFQLPSKLPMVCEPKDYEYKDDLIPKKFGGYLLNNIYYTNGIFKEKVGYDKETLLKNENLVVSLVNGLSKTPYKINTETLDFIYTYGLEKKVLIDENEKGIQDFLKNPYKKIAKKNQKLYWSTLSKLILQQNILSIADTFSKINKIYFPIRLCKRTRMYCETDYFNYQSNDLAKGLILFANPGKIIKTDHLAIKFLKGYGANMFGNGLDKKSLNNRVKWVDNNSDKLLDIENNNMVELAENKSCFISFCFEYKRFINFMNDKNKVVFDTYLPIRLDATCNGFQHLTLLTREAKLLNKLNLSISTYEDDPDDFYTYITEKTYIYLEKENNLLENSTNLNEYSTKYLNSIKKLLKVKFDRAVVKLVIMTEPYKASIYRLIEQIINKLDQHEEGKSKYYTYKNINVKLTRKDITVFVKAIKYIIGMESPKITELAKYLNELVIICTELKPQMAIPWRLPNGAEVLESYEIRKKDTYQAFSFIKANYTFIKYEKGKYSLKKQKDATMANLIHSLDASSIALLYKDFNKDLYTVHDCFAVTAENAKYLISKLSSVYIQMYSNNTYLVDFDKYIKLSINNKYGDKTYKLNDKVINLPNSTRPFPCINKILEYDSNIDITTVKESSYLAK